MPNLERRIVLSGLAAAPLAAPAYLRAQSPSRPVQIGLVSDMSGPFRDVGGPGNRVVAELAVQDFGGTVLGRPITIRQADGQNRADISAALARDGSTISASMSWPTAPRAPRGWPGAGPGR